MERSMAGKRDKISARQNSANFGRCCHSVTAAIVGCNSLVKHPRLICAYQSPELRPSTKASRSRSDGSPPTVARPPSKCGVFATTVGVFVCCGVGDG